MFLHKKEGNLKSIVFFGVVIILLSVVVFAISSSGSNGITGLVTGTHGNEIELLNEQTIQLIKGTSTFTFELKKINNSLALFNKLHYNDGSSEPANYLLWYKPLDCLVKTERGCHLKLINVFSSEDKSYVILKDMGGGEETNLTINSNTPFANSYTFDKPSDLFQRTNKYGTLLVQCPEEVSLFKINEKVNKIKKAIKTEIKSNEINRMLNECNKRDTFTIEGETIDVETQLCVDYLDNLLKTNLISNVEYSHEDLLQECEIRTYFNERFNKNKLKDYNQSLFNQLFKERDKEFTKKIIFEYNQRVEKLNLKEEVEAQHIENNGSVILIN